MMFGFGIETIVLAVISLILLLLLLLKSSQLSKLKGNSNTNALLDSINLPIFYKDKDGKFIGFNRAFERDFKLHKKQALDELKYFKTSEVKELDLVYDNGITKPTLVNFTNYLDGSIGVLIDTTSMKSDKTEILNKKEILEFALKGANEVYWELDVSNNNKLVLSKTAKDVLGFEDCDITPESLSELMEQIKSSDVEKTNEAFSLHVSGKSEFIDVEYRLNNPSKETWINLKGKGVLGKNKKIVKIYGTLQDITNQKMRLKSMIRQRDLFMTFVNNLPAIGFMKDDEGRYVYANRYFQQLIGMRQWKNKKVEEVFDSETSKNVIQSDKEAMYEGKKKHKEYIPTEEGTKLFETYKFPIDSEYGKVLCGFGLDITKEKAYQDKIELYSKIFDNTNEAIIITDKESKIISANSAY